MAKWLLIKIADDISDERVSQLLTDVTNHDASVWYESVPDVFKNAEALDKARNTWLADRHQPELVKK